MGQLRARAGGGLGRFEAVKPAERQPPHAERQAANGKEISPADPVAEALLTAADREHGWSPLKVLGFYPGKPRLNPFFPRAPAQFPFDRPKPMGKHGLG